MPIIILMFFLTGCDSSIKPILDNQKTYSIYGPLNINETPNYIRVHDNKALLSPEGTLPLDVEVTFTDLESGETEILEDRIIQFDSLYTHNFEVNMPIEFDSRYQVDMEDESGIRYSLTTVTTKESELAVLKDSVTCGSPFRIELSNIDLAAGEQLDAEVGVKLGSEWYWTHREMSRVYDQGTDEVVLSWTPHQISLYLLGPFDVIPCREFASDKIRFRFTHIGYVEELETTVPDNTGNSDIPNTSKQIVLSKYSGETEIQIHPCEFDGNPLSCNIHHDFD